MKKKTAEVTSKRVATVAGRILKKLARCEGSEVLVERHANATGSELVTLCTVADLRAIAGSALTQASDKKE